MYPIEQVEALNPEVTRMVVRAPEIAKKIKPGQFIMLRIDEQGERIPLTMNDCDPEAGTITIIFQAVGATTMRLAQMKAGDALQDFAGPLGNHTELEGAKRALSLIHIFREVPHGVRAAHAGFRRAVAEHHHEVGGALGLGERGGVHVVVRAALAAVHEGQGDLQHVLSLIHI